MPKPISRKTFLTLASLGTASAVAATVAVRGRTPRPTATRPQATPTVPAAPQHPELIEPGNPAYEPARFGFNLRVDKHPAVIARCGSTDDVARAIAIAKERGLPIAVRSGGHSLEGFSTSEGGMVLDVSAMNEVRVLDDGLVAIGPGCTVAGMYDALLPQGELVPTGSCGSVGLGGLVLGGGYGFFSRTRGLTCDSLVRATFVDGRGQVLRTEDEPDLDWAARGGMAANAAVATELVFRSSPPPSTMDTHRFRVRDLDAAHARALAATWFGQTGRVGRDVWSAFVLNGSVLTIVLKRTGPDDDGFERVSAAFERLTGDVNRVDARPIGEALHASYGLSAPTRFRCGSAGYYRDLADMAPVLDGVIPIVVTTRGFILQINMLGGAIADGTFPASAYPYRDRPYLAEIQTYWETAERPQELHTSYERAREVITNVGPGAHYASYPDLSIPNAQAAYFGASYARLTEIRRKYDPERTFRHPQSVGADAG